MRKTHILCSLSLAFLLGTSWAPSARAADVVTLRVAAINAAQTRSFTDMMVPWARQIEAQSGGRFKVELGGLGQYGKPNQLLDLMEKGQIEIVSSVPSYYGTRFPLSSVMEMPLLYDTGEQGTKIAWELYKEGLIAPDYKGFKVLALYSSMPYGIFSAIGPIKTLRDLRGLRVRAPGLSVGLALGRLGMIPMGMSTDMASATLSQGLMDGMSYSYDAGMSTPGEKGTLLDQMKYLVDARLAGPLAMVIMTQALYDRLPADLQQVIDHNSGVETSLRFAHMRDGWENEARSTMQADSNHVSIALSAEQRAEMKRRVAPVIEDWAATLSQQGVDGPELMLRARDIASKLTSG
jgi:TRAP-type C4-dicarboxylate transport system substrate-binding protein